MESAFDLGQFRRVDGQPGDAGLDVYLKFMSEHGINASPSVPCVEAVAEVDGLNVGGGTGGASSTSARSSAWQDGHWVLLHVNASVKALKDLARVARPGGVVMAIEPNCWQSHVATSRPDVLQQRKATLLGGTHHPDAGTASSSGQCTVQAVPFPMARHAPVIGFR